MDEHNSLAELTGVDWGAPPEAAAFLTRERHELRRTPLRELSHAGLVRLLDIGVDLDLLVPTARTIHDATLVLVASPFANASIAGSLDAHFDKVLGVIVHQGDRSRSQTLPIER